MKPEDSSEKFPEGLNNAYFFATCNALSFQIILGGPMVLYAKSLGASATVLGVITGMMPLMVIFQIPAANHVGRFGYKRFVLAGWGTRVCFIFVMALVPLTYPFLSQASRVGLLLFLLFLFNLSRGISSCAWLPWITQLVPAGVRGRYLARDAGFVGVASFAAFLIAAWALGSSPTPGRFAAIFLFSGLAGAVSLLFLRRIPEVEPPVEPQTSKTPVPWKAIASHPPFKRLLWMNLGWSGAYGGINAFTTSYLKTQANLPENVVLCVCAAFFAGGLSSLAFGALMDRMGSKPALSLGCVLYMGICLLWVGVAGGALEGSLLLFGSIQFLMGMAAALVSSANNRLAMAISPTMGRAHFFALFSVVASLSLGLSPVAWGVLIDFFYNLNTQWAGLGWNRFTLFYLGAAFWFLLTLLLTFRLQEPHAASLEQLMREVLIRSPQKFFLRLWPRW